MKKNGLIISLITMLALVVVLLLNNQSNVGNIEVENTDNNIIYNEDDTFDKLELTIWEYVMGNKNVDSAQVLIWQQDKEYFVSINTNINAELEKAFVDEVREYVMNLIPKLKNENIAWYCYQSEKINI